MTTIGTSPLAWLADAQAVRAAAGMRRQLRPRQRGEAVLDLASNDYLGLSGHPRVVEAAVAATREWGAGATGSRLVTGTTQLHVDLESDLIEFLGGQGALVFASGYAANLAAITALAGPACLVVSDAGNHASIVDACRLSRSELVVTPHADPAAVEAALATRRPPRAGAGSALVVTDSVFSVDGDLAPLAQLHAVCQRYGALLVVDEAHALGVVGPGGRGLVAAAGLTDQPDIVRTVTLSKSLGSQGGAVLADPLVIEHLINVGRSFIFDTGLAPGAVGAARAALAVVTEEPARVTALAERSARLAAIVGAPPPVAAVVSVVLGDPELALAAAADCLSLGVRVGCFRPPSVPAGTSRVRLTGRSTLTEAELTLADDVLSQVLPGGGSMSALVVTGTGTGVGKTIVTAAIAALAAERGQRVAVVKPAQTGLTAGEAGDVALVGELTGLTDLHELARYPDPLAPETAAQRAGQPPIRPADVAEHVAGLSDRDLVIVEGAGGLLVRFDPAGGTIADVAALLTAPVLVVTEAGLGTLNATALTVEALRRRGLRCAGIVIGSWPAEPDLASQTNLADLPRYTGAEIVGMLPAGAGGLDRARFLVTARYWLAPTLGGHFDPRGGLSPQLALLQD